MCHGITHQGYSKAIRHMSLRALLCRTVCNTASRWWRTSAENQQSRDCNTCMPLVCFAIYQCHGCPGSCLSMVIHAQRNFIKTHVGCLLPSANALSVQHAPVLTIHRQLGGCIYVELYGVLRSSLPGSPASSTSPTPALATFCHAACTRLPTNNRK